MATADPVPALGARAERAGPQGSALAAPLGALRLAWAGALRFLAALGASLGVFTAARRRRGRLQAGPHAPPQRRPWVAWRAALARLRVPSLRVPSLRVPSLRVPSLRLPSLRLPSLRLPSLRLPKPDLARRVPWLRLSRLSLLRLRLRVEWRRLSLATLLLRLRVRRHLLGHVLPGLDPRRLLRRLPPLPWGRAHRPAPSAAPMMAAPELASLSMPAPALAALPSARPLPSASPLPAAPGRAWPRFALPRLAMPPLRLLLPRLPRLTRRPRPAAIAEEAIGFQGELEDLLGERPPPFLGGAHYLVVALFLVLLLVSAIAEVDVVVTGQGRLAADSPPLVLQPIERAIIREIRVRPGEAVSRGQVLAVLDPTFAEADTASLTAQSRSLGAQARRIAAELAGEGAPVGTANEPDALLQAVLQAQRQAVRDARLRGFDEEIAALAAGIRSVEQAAGQRAEQVGLARDVETMRAQLAERQVGSRLNLLGARSARIQAEQELSQALGRITELQHSLLSKHADRQTFLDDWRRQLMEESVRVRGELIRVEEQLGKARRLTELTMVTAPQDAIVLEVARRSVGSVIREAEPLITLIPRDVPLIAEIALRSADIGQARPGDAVVIKVDAFPFQRHGTLQGRLRSIAQDSASRSETGDAHPPAAGLHAGQVQIIARGLTGLTEGMGITPGMTLTAEIKVGTRSVLSYFLNPITRGLQESLREP